MPTRYKSLELASDYVAAPAANGIDAVLMHALMGRRQYLEEFASDWRGQYGATLNIDLPGHGDSAMPQEDISIEASAASIVECMQEHRASASVLIGQSMGALLALQVAALAPNLVRAIVLLDPAPIVLDEATRKGWAGLLSMMEGEQYPEALNILIDAQSAPMDDPDRVSERAVVFQQADPQAVTRSFASMLNWDGAAALSNIEMPVMGIWAGRNNEPDVLIEHVPHALCGQVVASGHYVHIEAKEPVWAMLQRFISVSDL